jgi:hypothetical protein
MGIQGLTTKLAHHGHWITMEPSEEQQQQQQQNAAIVDGPGLAYHIYRVLCVEKAADAFVAYSEIGDRLIKFLDEMEGVGLPM